MKQKNVELYMIIDAAVNVVLGTAGGAVAGAVTNYALGNGGVVPTIKNTCAAIAAGTVAYPYYRGAYVNVMNLIAIKRTEELFDQEDDL